MMLNKCMFIGHLGKDPEVRKMSSGDSVVSFSLAVSEHWRDKNSGERKEKTEWVTIVIFNENVGKIAEQYLKKGSKCFVEGQLQTRKWTDKDGATRYSTEVVLQRFRGAIELLDGKSGGGERDEAPAASEGRGGGYADQKGRAASERSGNGRYAGELDDDIPF